MKRIYQWVLSWAESPYGALALFILAFSESIFFPVPPDVLLIALALGKVSRSFQYALTASIGSVLGSIAGYALGYYAWQDTQGEFTPFALFFFQHIPGFTLELFLQIKELFMKWDFWVIFTAGFTPIPYKVFTISGGVFEINFTLFVFASIVSRSARFFLISSLLWKFGPEIKDFIDRYFNLIALGFTVILAGGFVIIKYVI